MIVVGCCSKVSQFDGAICNSWRADSGLECLTWSFDSLIPWILKFSFVIELIADCSRILTHATSNWKRGHRWSFPITDTTKSVLWTLSSLSRVPCFTTPPLTVSEIRAFRCTITYSYWPWHINVVVKVMWPNGLKHYIFFCIYPFRASDSSYSIYVCYINYWAADAIA